jgi:hypothetical protein
MRLPGLSGCDDVKPTSVAQPVLRMIQIAAMRMMAMSLAVISTMRG